MKKSLYILLAFAAVTLSVVGCSKKKGNNGAYVPSACFNGGMGFGNNFGGGIGGVNGFQWRNGQCIDIRTNTVANQAACAGVANQYSGAMGCNFYGGNNFFTGSASGAYNACSVYNGFQEQFYPVYYPNLGISVCAGYSALNTMMSFGTPSYYGNSQNVYRGCIPGSDPRCQSFGGTLGWFHAGVQLGVYF